jgi:hypothetical protein
MTGDVVSFYLPERRALCGRDPLTLDPDRNWEVFGTGVYVWILQTFLRLRHAGAPVRLDASPPSSGVVVAHADYVERLLGEAEYPARLTIVSARADRRPQLLADVEIVQNASSAEDYQIFIPSWLQPGLIPRDLSRGNTVKEIAYVGARKQLHAELATPEWVDTLRALGFRWDMRMIAFASNDQLYSDHRWNDYSTTDVMVALRPPELWAARSKPAAKLQNAWAAGTPAVLSPERAYKELRRSELDYLEARSAAEVIEAVRALRSNASLYRGMVLNGEERARDYHPDRLVARWIEALWEEVPARVGGPAQRLLAHARRYRALARRARRGWRTGHTAWSGARHSGDGAAAIPREDDSAPYAR